MSDLVRNPKDRFSHVEAHMLLGINKEFGVHCQHQVMVWSVQKTKNDCTFSIGQVKHNFRS